MVITTLAAVFHTCGLPRGKRQENSHASRHFSDLAHPQPLNIDWKNILPAICEGRS